jgi:selenoprotein W-related protein
MKLLALTNIALCLSPWVVSSFHIPGRLISSAPKYASASAALHMAAEDPTRISIEYCTGCRWMLKSFWMAQELLTTFEDELDAVTVVPSSSKGVYSIKLNGNDILWDRKGKGGFPSTKVLKQIIRDKVTPEKFLGHSDTKDRQEEAPASTSSTEESVEFPLRGEEIASVSLSDSEAPSPTVTITYCTGCRWMLRAAYFGQELLTTFGEELKSVILVASKPPAKGGQFVRGSLIL